MIERRIGAFGGTFDPIHNGHVAVAREVVRNFELDRLLMIPAHRPPHKTGRPISNGFHRYTMSVLAMLDQPAVAVSTLELEAPERPYTFETIGRLRGLYGDEVELFFIMGADSFEEVNTWRESERVLESANWIVVARPGHHISTTHLPEHLRAQIVDLRGGRKPSIKKAATRATRATGAATYLTDYVSEEISSTRIREMARDGQEIAGLVPPPVAGYIEKYGLYRQ